jgi:uncharacterized short protein YbdD (DUF466 family)
METIDPMAGVLKTGRRAIRRFWRGLREWCGDSAYERYLRASATKDVASRCVLTKEQFYVDQLNRRYSRPNRCC